MSNLAIKIDFPTRYLGRNEFGACQTVPSEILALVAQVKAAVGWKEGIEDTGYKGGYEARHVDVYGYDVASQLAVVQLRRCWKKKDSWYPEVSKAYALIGIDDGQVFSHTIDGSPRRQRDFDYQAPEDTVKWAEAKIFNVPVAKLSTIIRQGDIALVPIKSLPSRVRKVALPDGQRMHTVTLAGSHAVTVDGDLFEKVYTFRDGHEFVEDRYAVGLVESDHARGQHAPICAEGRFRLAEGLRGVEPWWTDTELGD